MNKIKIHLTYEQTMGNASFFPVEFVSKYLNFSGFQKEESDR